MTTSRPAAAPFAAVALAAVLVGCGEPAPDETAADEGCQLAVTGAGASNVDPSAYRIAPGEEGTGRSIACAPQTGGCTWQLLSQAMPGRTITGSLDSPAGTPDAGATFPLAPFGQAGSHLGYSEPYDGGRRHWQATGGSIVVDDVRDGRLRLRVDASMGAGDQNEVGTGTFRLGGSCTLLESP